MVEEWLERLKRAIELANIEVHRCNSGSFHLDRKLSGKITSMHNEISNIAEDLLTLFLQLGMQLKDLIREESGQHGAPLNGSSHNRYGYGCPNSGYLVYQDSSLINGYDSSGSSHYWGGSRDDSSVHSSSSGYASSGAAFSNKIKPGCLWVIVTTIIIMSLVMSGATPLIAFM